MLAKMEHYFSPGCQKEKKLSLPAAETGSVHIKPYMLGIPCSYATIKRPLSSLIGMWLVSIVFLGSVPHTYVFL